MVSSSLTRYISVSVMLVARPTVMQNSPFSYLMMTGSGSGTNTSSYCTCLRKG